jgi:hypothetical protein
VDELQGMLTSSGALNSLSEEAKEDIDTILTKGGARSLSGY